MAPNITYKDDQVYHHVEMKSLPSFIKLQSKVRGVIQKSTTWELYGVDWLYALGAVALVPLALFYLSHDEWVYQALGIFLMGCYHGTLANKTGHLAAHGGLGTSAILNKFIMRFSVDFLGAFSSKVAGNIHIKVHHPHTNIIGLGDSSTWKVPFLPRIAYMFLAPLTFPILTPLVALYEIIIARDLQEFFTWLTLSISGVAFHMWLLIQFSGYTVLGSFTCTFVFRTVLAIPYIHINIFQHIGLPVYSQENRPARIYQMSTGVLNLDSSLFLNATFGHSLISCHVEHHLFPMLSDNMCLKIRPLVREYLVSNGLTYNEKSYWNRLQFFVKHYDTLMVDAPPITHFVGLQ